MGQGGAPVHETPEYSTIGCGPTRLSVFVVRHTKYSGEPFGGRPSQAC